MLTFLLNIANDAFSDVCCIDRSERCGVSAARALFDWGRVCDYWHEGNYELMLKNESLLITK
jgi:hypothetical protein